MSSNEKLVSIVIPCYNTELYIKEAIESALFQTYPKVEVIVIDDGSTDNSYQIISEYKNKVKIIRQENSGVSVSRNTGVMNSNGDYIMFLDSDDVLSPETVNSKVKILDSDENVGLVIGNFHILTENGVETEHYPFRSAIKQEDQFNECVRRSLGQLDPIYRREVFTNCGLYDPFLPSCEDIDHCIRTASKYSLGYDHNVYGYYRKLSSDSLSKNEIRQYTCMATLFKKNAYIANNRYRYYLSSHLCLSKMGLPVFLYILRKFKLSSPFFIAKYSLKHPFFPIHTLLGIVNHIVYKFKYQRKSVF